VSSISREGALTTGVADTRAVLERFVLGDLLDDAILGARPGEKGFPLRVLFGELGARLGEDQSFTLLSGLNFFFRSEMEDEDKLRLGFEVSRLYYAFARAIGMDDAALKETSPLLATLMTSELSRLAFESVDHVGTFDSRFHEREPGADPHGAKIKTPASFLAKVTQNSMVRMKARVLT
jgi:hypothetical protein